MGEMKEREQEKECERGRVRRERGEGERGNVESEHDARRGKLRSITSVLHSCVP